MPFDVTSAICFARSSASDVADARLESQLTSSPTATMSAPIPVDISAALRPRSASDAARVATACAFVAAVARTVEPASVRCAATPVVAAALFVVLLAVLAVVAEVLAVVATVDAVVLTASSDCFTALSPRSLFHIFFSELSVTSEKALSLLRVCWICCSPIVIAITLCTRSMICCSFSFSAPNNPIAPCATEAAPERPDKPEMRPCIPRWSCARIVA